VLTFIVRTTGLTALGAVIGAIGGIAGICAFVGLLRLQASINDLDDRVRSLVGDEAPLDDGK
jgi:hypothetical protein